MMMILGLNASIQYPPYPPHYYTLEGEPGWKKLITTWIDETVWIIIHHFHWASYVWVRKCVSILRLASRLTSGAIERQGHHNKWLLAPSPPTTACQQHDTTGAKYKGHTRQAITYFLDVFHKFFREAFVISSDTQLIRQNSTRCMELHSFVSS